MRWYERKPWEILLTAIWIIGTGVSMGVCLAFALTGGV